MHQSSNILRVYHFSNEFSSGLLPPRHQGSPCKYVECAETEVEGTRKEEYKMQCNNEITAGGSVRDDIGKIDFLLRRI